MFIQTPAPVITKPVKKTDDANGSILTTHPALVLSGGLLLLMLFAGSKAGRKMI